MTWVCNTVQKEIKLTAWKKKKVFPLNSFTQTPRLCTVNVFFPLYNSRILPSYIVKPSENSQNLTVSKHMAVKKTKTRESERKQEDKRNFRERDSQFFKPNPNVKQEWHTKHKASGGGRLAGASIYISFTSSVCQSIYQFHSPPVSASKKLSVSHEAAWQPELCQ